jgi:hypothetical protein
MIRLEPKALAGGEPVRRLWLVFFDDGTGRPWWSWFLRPGFRHVCAAAWYADERRWVYFNPSRRGLVIEILDEEEFGPRFELLLSSCTAALRFASRFERQHAPALWHCVGAIKALLGVRSCALAPHGLYRDLVAKGAEIIEVPARGRTVRHTRHPAASAGGPGSETPAGPGATPG